MKNVYLGFDHGTTSIRFAVISDDGVSVHYEMLRKDAGAMSLPDLQNHIEAQIGFSLSEITMACLTYSMGDGVSEIQNIRTVSNRGVLSAEGVGEKTGAGAKIFDLFKNSSCPTVLLPGLHKNSPTDPRMTFFSHQAGPDKIGIAYYAYCLGHRRFIVSDIGSNTVTLAFSEPQILGAIDACIFAPGRRQGPLDVQAIRDVDAGKQTANAAFSNGGVGPNPQMLAFYAAMEIRALDVLMKDYSFENYDILISGSGSTDKELISELQHLLQTPVIPLGKWAAAIGCAEIAKSIAKGEKKIFGIAVI
ncbi:MAG: methanogenesis marker 12 protein [Methanimicrococcus sp.]|nr:methanogenesis marker 12 protein [Methanimicrococcus sp.]